MKMCCIYKQKKILKVDNLNFPLCHVISIFLCFGNWRKSEWISPFWTHSQYSCIDDSWTSIYVMHPMWNYLVEVRERVRVSHQMHINPPTGTILWSHEYIYEFSISPKTVLSHLARTKSHHIRCFHSERLELYPLRILWLWLQLIDRNSTLGVSVLRTECLHLLHTRWDWWQTSETNGNIDTVGRAIWSRSRQLQHTIHNDLSLQSVWRCKLSTLSYATHDVQCLLKLLCEYHHLWVS